MPNLSDSIEISRDRIRNQLVEEAKKYLELNDIDLTKSSFISYIINILSTLTSNLLFYESSVYREFFLTQAQIPESILNLASFIGYSPKRAQAASTSLLISIPYTFSFQGNNPVTIIIPNSLDDPPNQSLINYYNKNAYFETKDGIQFRTDSYTIITIQPDWSTEIQNTRFIEGNESTVLLPYDPPNSGNNNTMSFLLPVYQYSIEDFEFQVPELLTNQFYVLNVNFNGQLSNLTVKVNDVEFTEIESIFLMTNNDNKYVVRRNDNGATITFGNGIFGKQLNQGDTIYITIQKTEGSEGNVISGSINKGPRIYTDDRQLVNYSVINAYSAKNGSDEENIEEIRRNAIRNLQSLSKLVTSTDYTNLDVILSDSPFTDSVPVLKRSDLKINEVQTYVTLEFNNDIVPTRNIFFDVTAYFQPEPNNVIARNTIVNFDGDDYIIPFEIHIDSINSSAKYFYTIQEVDLLATLVSYSLDKTLNISNINITRNTNDNIDITISYDYDGVPSNLDCTIIIEETNIILQTNNNPDDQNNSGTFTLLDSNRNNFPNGPIKLKLNISDNSQPNVAAVYSISITIREDISDFMFSTVADDGSGNKIIYDVPVIDYSYYQSINSKDFEITLMQYIASVQNFSEYRMLTDSTILKFTNTTGKITNMLLNKTTKNDVLSRSLTSIPTNPNIGDRYIVNGNEDVSWKNKKDYIAQYDGSNWIFVEPSIDDIIYISDESIKVIYGKTGWIELGNYPIPLQIEILVKKDPSYTISYIELSNSIKQTLIEYFQDRFGSNTEIYRSEIIDVVQNINGVHHCDLIKPQSSIFFTFSLEDLTEQQLLEYSPQYVYFTEDNISISIV